MRVTFIAVGLFCGIFMRQAAAQQPVSEPVEPVSSGLVRYSYFFGKQGVLRLNDDVILQTPKWTWNTPNPPVSAKSAIEKGSVIKKELLKDNHDWFWGLASVALTPFNPENPGDEKTPSCWYWLITYEAFPTGGMTGPSSQFQVAVLMDGTVVRPDIRDYRPVVFGGESESNHKPGKPDVDDSSRTNR